MKCSNTLGLTIEQTHMLCLALLPLGQQSFVLESSFVSYYLVGELTESNLERKIRLECWLIVASSRHHSGNYGKTILVQTQQHEDFLFTTFQRLALSERWALVPCISFGSMQKKLRSRSLAFTACTSCFQRYSRSYLDSKSLSLTLVRLAFFLL